MKKRSHSLTWWAVSVSRRNNRPCRVRIVGHGGLGSRARLQVKGKSQGASQGESYVIDGDEDESDDQKGLRGIPREYINIVQRRREVPHSATIFACLILELLPPFLPKSFKGLLCTNILHLSLNSRLLRRVLKDSRNTILHLLRLPLNPLSSSGNLPLHDSTMSTM